MTEKIYLYRQFISFNKLLNDLLLKEKIITEQGDINDIQ